MKRAVWGELYTPRLTLEHVLAVKVHVPLSSVKALRENQNWRLDTYFFVCCMCFLEVAFIPVTFFF